MIAFTTSCYTMGKLVGPEAATEVIQRMVRRDPSVGNMPSPECVQCVHNLERVTTDAIAVHAEASTSHLGAMRSRAQHFAMEQGASIWISCDDDNTASVAALSVMLKWLERDEPTAVAIPCALRTGNRDNVQVVPSVPVKYLIGQAHPVVPIEWAGFGIVGVNRAALQLIAKQHDGLAFLDVDGVTRLASFAESWVETWDGDQTVKREWLREDRAWWYRLPRDVQRLAVCAGESTHAGRTIDLWDWSKPLLDPFEKGDEQA